MSKDQPKILVVEDEPDVCDSFQSYFGRRGFLVSTTPSGSEALTIIKTSKPDIVILDLKLSDETDINGVDVLRTLRKNDKKTKVIVITGQMFNDKEIDKIRSLGISEYLHKPVGLEKLQKIIERVLDKKLPSKSPVKATKSKEPAEASLRSIVHELSNLLGIIRNKCENFTLDIEDGIHKDKSDKELLKMAVGIMNIVINTVERATQAVEKISNLVKKRNE
jgi:two-component system nitrogen regulation response regulator GlnG